MYGTAMPILFPIAMFSFVVLYIQEVYLLYYVSKAPPTYDEQLNFTVLKALKASPFFLFSFGFW